MALVFGLAAALQQAGGAIAEYLVDALERVLLRSFCATGALGQLAGLDEFFAVYADQLVGRAPAVVLLCQESAVVLCGAASVV